MYEHRLTYSTNCNEHVWLGNEIHIVYSLVHAREIHILLLLSACTEHVYPAFHVRCSWCLLREAIDSQRLPAYAPAFNPHLKIGKEGTASPATAQALNDRKPTPSIYTGTGWSGTHHQTDGTTFSGEQATPRMSAVRQDASGIMARQRCGKGHPGTNIDEHNILSRHQLKWIGSAASS